MAQYMCDSMVLWDHIKSIERARAKGEEIDLGDGDYIELKKESNIST